MRELTNKEIEKTMTEFLNGQRSNPFTLVKIDEPFKMNYKGFEFAITCNIFRNPTWINSNQPINASVRVNLLNKQDVVDPNFIIYKKQLLDASELPENIISYEGYLDVNADRKDGFLILTPLVMKYLYDVVAGAVIQFQMFHLPGGVETFLTTEIKRG